MPRANQFNFKKFKKEHTTCVYCAETNIQTTIDHMPPQRMFKNALNRPNQLIFPSCKECNNYTSKYDLAVCYFSRLLMSEEHRRYECDLGDLFKRIRRNCPDFYWALSTATHEEVKVNPGCNPDITAKMIITDESAMKIVDHYLGMYSTKVGFALHYQETGRVISKEGLILSTFQMNEWANTSNPDIKILENLNYMEQGKNNTKGFFEYKTHKLKEGVYFHITRITESLVLSSLSIEDKEEYIQNIEEYKRFEMKAYISGVFKIFEPLPRLPMIPLSIRANIFSSVSELGIFSLLDTTFKKR